MTPRLADEASIETFSHTLGLFRAVLLPHVFSDGAAFAG